MDVGCYCIHSARLLFGDEPISVCGSAKMDGGIDITMTGILNFSGGRMALFDVSFESASRQLMEIVGTEGVILVERPWKAEVEPAKLSIGPSRAMRMDRSLSPRHCPLCPHISCRWKPSVMQLRAGALYQ